MRQLFVLTLIVSFLTSCSESYKTRDPKIFNQKISNRTDIKSPEELIKIYYNYTPSEGIPKLTIYAKDLGDNSFEVTLIHEGFADDSLAGMKIVMTAKQVGQTWTVIEIKENWKCLDDRGHTSWGITPCS